MCSGGCVCVASVRAWARMAQQGGGQAWWSSTARLIECAGVASIGRCGCTDGLYAVIAAQLLLFACARTHCLLREGPQGEVAGKTAGRRVGVRMGRLS